MDTALFDVNTEKEQASVTPLTIELRKDMALFKALDKNRICLGI